MLTLITACHNHVTRQDSHSSIRSALRRQEFITAYGYLVTRLSCLHSSLVSDCRDQFIRQTFQTLQLLTANICQRVQRQIFIISKLYCNVETIKIWKVGSIFNAFLPNFHWILRKGHLNDILIKNGIYPTPVVYILLQPFHYFTTVDIFQC